jgi:hypothetical protein
LSWNQIQFIIPTEFCIDIEGTLKLTGIRLR